LEAPSTSVDRPCSRGRADPTINESVGALGGEFNERYNADMEIEALIHKAEEGGYWAEVPSMPGCVTQGETLDEIMVNLAEAAEGWLETSSDEPQQIVVRRFEMAA
jgi:predicted RNase H-like HicB family nuclease